ncbi:dnaJ homolog subfamily C member 27-A-like [Crassostrea angulata]|uniref:DnaJ-like protein subfamily C member 27-A n=1 Tax=Magallana gigas TaxID=29159 RepID=K1PJ50_MAGGI|nr:dnaJ homolog subfamily C member 27-A [Crassostrea gigas]XP_052721557.1 dnaJ homolog subfamily C member 27-A-like [Crassostrea angulata]|eukprot:XP_011417163.1 PREDICTED: dnaJ homolog subfamily C member 27-A [Crassostrea gigas]
MDRKPGHLTKNAQDAVNSLVWIKVVGIGNGCVGKTCLIKHFCESKFSGGYQPTVGVDYGFKIQHVEGVDLRVHLWDLSGSPEYIDVRNELYINTDAIFLVFDVTNLSTFENMENWLKEVQKYSSGNPELIVVANKIDLKAKRVVKSEDSKKWAQQNNAKYYETSAASGEGVDRLFNDMLTGLIERKKLWKAKSANPSI